MTNEVPYPPPTNGVFRSFPLLLSESNIRKESCKTFLIEMHLQQQIIKTFASKLGQSIPGFVIRLSSYEEVILTNSLYF